MTTIAENTPGRTAPASDMQLVALVKDAHAGDELAWEGNTPCITGGPNRPVRAKHGSYRGGHECVRL